MPVVGRPMSPVIMIDGPAADDFWISEGRDPHGRVVRVEVFDHIIYLRPAEALQVANRLTDAVMKILVQEMKEP